MIDSGQLPIVQKIILDMSGVLLCIDINLLVNTWTTKKLLSCSCYITVLKEECDKTTHISKIGGKTLSALTEEEIAQSYANDLI